MRRAWGFMGLIAFFCFSADWLTLALLPRLGLSYGPVGLPLALFTSGRLCLLRLSLPGLLLARDRGQRLGVVVLSSGMQVVLLGMALYGLGVEPFRLRVTELTVQAPGFQFPRPLRILQLSDVHIERMTKREHELLRRVHQLQPDLIVLTGDFVNLDYLDDPAALREAHDFLSQLSAPYGVFAVTGTTDSPEVKTKVFEGLNIQQMDDRALTLSFPGRDLTLIGVADTNNWDRDRRKLLSLLGDVPQGAYTLLLYHTPDLIETAAAGRIDLYLAGHTHGGQVRLPLYGAVLTFSRYGKKYEAGNYFVESTRLYVSRGLGMEGWNMPRIRFLCPPEIIQFTFIP